MSVPTGTEFVTFDNTTCHFYLFLFSYISIKAFYFHFSFSISIFSTHFSELSGTGL